MLDDDDAPPCGEVVTVHFECREASVWWGYDGDISRLAVRGGRVLTWPTADACEEHARDANWPGLGAEDGDETITRSNLDFEPVQAWLRGQRATLEPVAALDLWNFEDDMVASRTRAPRLLHGIGAHCDEKLTAANVPWLVGMDSYSPRWTGRELRYLRRALSDAVHALRTELGVDR